VLTAYVQAALDGETKRVRHATEGTRNNTLVRAAFNLGQLVDSLDSDLAEEQLLDAALIAGLTEDEATITIRSGMVNGQEHPRTPRSEITDRQQALIEVRVIARMVDEVGWGGHEGKRQYRVLLACLLIALELGGAHDLPLSTNRLRLVANISSRALIQRALHELREDGWLKVSGPGHATRYTLQVPCHLSRPQAITNQPYETLWPCYATPSAQVVDTPGHDAFHRHALDTTRWRILRYLSQHPGWQTQSSVARGLGISRSTVWKAVRRQNRLVEHTLILRNEHGHVAANTDIDTAVLDEVAEAMHTIGVRDRLRHRLQQHYIDMGWLTPGLHWIDQRTGQVLGAAKWLLNEPEHDTEDQP